MSLIRRITTSQLIRSNLLLFLGNNISSLGNFIFNLFMARLLTPGIYGEMGAIFSLLVLLSIPLHVLNLSVVKVVSEYWGEQKTDKIHSILSYLTPRLFILSALSVIIIISTSSLIGQFLRMENYYPLLIVAFYFLLVGPVTANRATLHGILAFPYLAVNGIVEVGIKVVVSVLFVVLNFGLSGALFGPLVGGIAGYILTLIEIRILLKGSKKERINPSSWKLISTFVPVLTASIALLLFFSIDIILVRHFFEDNIAGEYTALATVGRIIYYVVGPVITVMFPIVSNRIKKQLNYMLPLFGTLVLSLGLATGIITCFFLFPRLIVGVLFGDRYYGIIPYLGIFSFYMTIYSVNAILTHFLLSVSYYKPIYILLLISFFQGILIYLIHPTISYVIYINIFVSIIYLLIAAGFILYKERSIIMGMFSKILPFDTYVQ